MDCDSSQQISQLIDKLTKTCKNIQVLQIYIYNTSLYNGQVEVSLSGLIKRQKQIRSLDISAYGNLKLTKEFKEAILTHSNSITNYEIYGYNNLDSLVPKFRNLRSLTLIDCDI